MKMNFKQWLEWGNPGEIRGEYWVIDGFVDFADGDVVDKNHEGIAIEHVVSYYSENIVDLAEEMDIECKIDTYGEIDTEKIIKVLDEIRDKLVETIPNPDAYIMNKIGCDEYAYNILWGSGDASSYVMKKWGWIAIRSNNVEFYGYNQKRQKEIADAIEEILSQEREEADDSVVSLSMEDLKTNRYWTATLEELKSPVVGYRPSEIPQKPIYNRPAYYITPKKDTTVPSKTNAWKQQLGSEPWRLSSESII